jgi:hypothetical protein
LVKRNYRQAKRQKEDARKARQLQKQQRRSDRTPAADSPEAIAPDAHNNQTADPAAVPKLTTTQSR